MDILQYRDKDGNVEGYCVVSDPIIIDGHAQPLTVLYRSDDEEGAFVACEGYVAGYKAAQPSRPFELTSVSSGGFS